MEAQAKRNESNVDRSQTRDEALENASLAAELYMKATKLASTESERSRLRDKCKQLLSRAEEIKNAPHWSPMIPKEQEHRLSAPVSIRELTRREEIILLEGSKLHGFIFPPWTSEPDDSVFSETFNGSRFYTDATDLELSDAQRQIFAGWRRPHELLNQPLKAELGSSEIESSLMTFALPIDLVQDITTDCSVVASLCAGTARTSKGHDKLLASICYPYNKTDNRPRLSGNGKYIFRLHFNGCYRRVTIDDRLPASNTSRSLHVIDRNNPNLIWPALVEKAYLKVRGGYDFPGSNSGTDLWVMTGWMPEQVFLRSDDILPEQLWNRLFKSFGYGDVIITLGTGRLSHKEEKALGLAGEHDYAVLDMKEVGPQKLLLIKNPWCDGMVWKKSVYVPEDAEEDSWSEGLRSALPDNPATTSSTFWMSFDDVVQHFENLYLNWNPGLFRYRQDHHFSWIIPTIENPGCFIHNPQYAIKSSKKDTVWILLSRHFATGEQTIMKNKSTATSTTPNTLGFISIYAFEASGRRVYLSDDALHRGAYVDSPQTLARLEVLPHETYTIVAVQHGLPLPKYSFTLSFFSRQTLSIEPATDSLPHSTTNTGSWTSRTAGGNASAPSYPLNPQYSITVPSATAITLVLETDQQELAVHVKMVWAGGERVSAVTGRDIIGESGDYRRGCALASLTNVAAGKYTIVCSTFEAGQTGNFTLRVGSMAKCVVRALPAETAGRMSIQLPVLVFQDGVNRMLAPLSITRLTRFRVIARPRSRPAAVVAAAAAGTGPPGQGGPGQGQLPSNSVRSRALHSSSPSSISSSSSTSAARSRALLRLSIEKNQGPNKTVLEVSGSGDFSDAPMGIRTRDLDVGVEMARQGGLWIVVERLSGGGGRPRGGEEDVVDVEVLSDGVVEVGLWGTGDG